MIHLREDYDQIQDPSGKIPADEPVFLLRGKDRCAPGAIEAWAALAEASGADAELVARVRQWANEIRNWQARTGSKTPDVPAGALRDGTGVPGVAYQRWEIERKRRNRESERRATMPCFLCMGAHAADACPERREAAPAETDDGCPEVGVGGGHSNGYYEGNRCARCGARAVRVGTRCPAEDCGAEQFRTPSGLCCENGHGY